MSEPRRAGGRRAATRERGPGRMRAVGPAAVLAIVVPLAVVGGAVGLAPGDPRPAPDEPPSRVSLESQDLVCPPPGGLTAPVTVGRAPGTGDGEVSVRGGEADEEVAPPSGGSAEPVTVAGAPAVVTGTGPAAPGLLAGRFATDVTAGTACAPPAAEQWFTGLGAGPERSSVVELVNPGGGDAVADLTLLGPEGPVDAPEVEGVTVPARDSVRLELGSLVPTTDELAARVAVVRGRLGVSVLDRVSPVGGEESADWSGSQPQPAETLLVPGLPGGDGARRLVVANPGEDDAQVEIRVATPSGAVAPVDTPPLEVPAGGVASRDLDEVLADQVADGAGGLVLDSSAPVTATLRSLVRDDLAASAAVPVVPGAAAGPDAADPGPGPVGLVPDGDARVVLVAPPEESAGGSPAEVDVVARDADGEEVATTTAEVAPGGVAEVDLPGPAASVSLEGDRRLAASLLVRRGEGTVVIGLRPPVVDGLVPAVRRGLP